MTFVHTAFLSEHHAEFTYLTIGIPENKSFEDLKTDWLKIRSTNIDKDSLDNSLNSLEKMGYILTDLPIFEFFEN